jgi:hypothetical protein
LAIFSKWIGIAIVSAVIIAAKISAIIVAGPLVSIISNRLSIHNFRLIILNTPIIVVISFTAVSLNIISIFVLFHLNDSIVN